MPTWGSEVLATVASSSNPSKTYDIIKGGDGVIYCTCTAWKMHKDCKHLRQYHSGNAVSAVNAVKPTKATLRQEPAESISALIAKEVAFLKGCR